MNRPRIPVRPIPLISFPSRRDLLRGLTSAGLALPIARLPESAAKKRRKRQNKKKVRRNAFGCVNVGGFCKTSDQCCSGICTGKKSKKQCRAHDTQGCQADQDACAEDFGTGCPEVPTASCFRTTGDAGFCGFFEAGACVACTKDADCLAAAGPIAACVVCPACVATNTACIPGPA
jgi:hypothetical protein